MNIVVTIPKAKLREIEAEEADVARRETNGETNICYYWQMSRVPRIQPNRIYFVWGNAIRAYHDVIGMEPGKIFMATKINELDKPIPMISFRGYRYFDEKKVSI